MNIQSIMKQAQAMQKNIMNAKDKIDKTNFEGKSEMVTVVMNGKREIISVTINNKEDFDVEDLEILEDMVMIAFNDALKKIDLEIKNKLGSQTGQLGGLF